MDGVLPRHTKPGTAPGTWPAAPSTGAGFTWSNTPEMPKTTPSQGRVDECRFHLGTPGHTWIDVAGRPSSEMLRDLGAAFDLHPLALEDVFHGNQRAKLDHLW